MDPACWCLTAAAQEAGGKAEKAVKAVKAEKDVFLIEKPKEL